MSFPFVNRHALLLVTIALAGCGRERAAAPAQARSVVDDFGHTVEVREAARIVSLNPTTTEILFTIGAGDRVVGRTEWDAWPSAAGAVPNLGPGIRPNVEAILAARPDLVILYGGQDNRDAARTLRAAGVSTIGLKVDRIADFRRATMLLGAYAGDTARARKTVDSVDRTLARVRAATAGLPRPRVVWQLWDAPLLVLGAGSFQHELIGIAGGRNVYGDIAAPTTQASLEDVLTRAPDVVLTDGARARAIGQSARWAALRAVQRGHVLVVDVELTSRTSVTLGMGALSLARLLHPTLRID